MGIENLAVEKGEQGLRLDEFLSLRWPRWSKGYLRSLIRRGLVSLNGRALERCSHFVRRDDLIQVDLPANERVPLHSRLRVAIVVLYEDDSLWVIDKPSGVAVEPERWDPQGTHLAGAVLDYLENRDVAIRAPGATIPFRPRLVHRLDKGTSGVLVFAKNLEAERSLRRQFHDHEVVKEYYALVDGEVPAGGGEVDLPLRPGKSGRMLVTSRSKGRPSFTRYEVAKAYRGLSWVRCFPRTGRTHQIRVHLAARGFPLAVDPLYGRRSQLFLSEIKAQYHPARGRRERPLLERLALHAAAIEIDSPLRGRVRIESPLPADLAVVLKQLGRWRAR